MEDNAKKEVVKASVAAAGFAMLLETRGLELTDFLEPEEIGELTKCAVTFARINDRDLGDPTDTLKEIAKNVVADFSKALSAYKERDNNDSR